MNTKLGNTCAQPSKCVVARRSSENNIEETKHWIMRSAKEKAADRSRVRISALLLAMMMAVGVQTAQSQTGVMIVSDTNPGLAINGNGGAMNGRTLEQVSNCTTNNTDHTWTYSGAPLVTVPNVTDDPAQQASDTLQAVGLHMKVLSVSGHGPWVVGVQRPAAGTSVAIGSTVSVSLVMLQ